MSGQMTARQVQRAIWLHFAVRQTWAVLFEVTARPQPGMLDKLELAEDQAEADRIRAEFRERRIDALVLRRRPKPKAKHAGFGAFRQHVDGGGDPALFEWVEQPEPTGPAAANPLEALALEIKVTRADFLSDVRDEYKQQPWRRMADRHAYIVPAGLVVASEVPATSGLIEVKPGGALTWTRKAPRSVAPPLPVEIHLDAFYRTSRAEARQRGVTGEIHVDEPEEMRAELLRLRNVVKLAEGREDRMREELLRLRKLAAVSDPPPCSTCGKPLRPASRGRAEYGQDWEHRSAADEQVCRPLRRPADAASNGWRLTVPFPEPRYDDSCMVHA